MQCFEIAKRTSIEITKRKFVSIGRCEYGKNELLKVIYSHLKNSGVALAKIITCKKAIFIIY